MIEISHKPTVIVGFLFQLNPLKWTLMENFYSMVQFSCVFTQPVHLADLQYQSALTLLTVTTLKITALVPGEWRVNLMSAAKTLS